MSKGKLIFVVGTSGVGKTHLANEIIFAGVGDINDKYVRVKYDYDPEYDKCVKEFTTDHNNVSFYHTKYVTRPLRSEDVGIVHCDSKEEMEEHCDIIMPGYCDGEFIGYNINDVFREIDQGKFPVIVSGFMEMLQETLCKFADEDRLDDIYIVGIHGVVKLESDYLALAKKRYGKNAGISEDVKKRCQHQRLFMRQFFAHYDIFDYTVKNYLIKYLAKTDLFGEGHGIWMNAYKREIYKRSEKQKQAIMEFIRCDLSQYEPVQDDEVRVFGTIPKSHRH